MSDSESGTPGAQSPLSRRSVLKGLAGAAGLAVVPGALLEACSSSKKTTAPPSSAAPSTSAAAAPSSAAAATSSAAVAPASSAGGGGGAATGTITFGSNYSDAVPKAAFAAMIGGFTSANPNAKVTINTVDHNTFQNNINNYLQGTPDDLFTWFAGFRMRFFASQGLATPIDDVWDKIGANFSDAFKSASKGDDGHYYFVPLYNYPWCVFYRKSVFAAKGYQIPTTWDAFVALQKQMQKDGLVPMAMGEKDAWPALGTFDIINMRLNGFQFHMDLMAHKVPWDDPKVLAVFTQWTEILPYQQAGANGRIWLDAAKTLLNKQAGMYLLGSFVAQQFTGADLDDLDFFPYPAIDPANAQDAIDAPIDGFMMSKKVKNQAGATALLEYIGTAAAEALYGKTDPSDVAAATNADTSNYNAIQKKSAQIISSSKDIAQFLDRDTNPDFADNTVSAMIQSFFNNPKDAASLLKGLEGQAKTVFTS
ncbi:MAG TPA: ABC transporter substrate-binding protein [Acidothermaceae bacterium]|nr:ABC transporter substrate-binding protein [Acidothermaceae bacterium]